MVSHIEQSGKNAPMRLRSDFRVAVSMKNRLIENQAQNVQNPFLTNNIGDGTLPPQSIPGGTGTRPKAGGAHEFNSFF